MSLKIGNAVHHIAVIGTNYEDSRHFYVDVLGFEVVREVWREEKQDWKIDLALDGCELELFILPKAPPRPSWPEAAGLRHLAFRVKSVAEAAARLKLNYVVVTSVTRDDLPDGGAEQFAKCVRAIREVCPGTTVETLISDMKGDHAALDTVIAAHPEVLNHNVETVKELQGAVRPQARYERSLGVLRYCKEQDPTLLTKTGFMVGLGETEEQISALMDDILATGCDILTIGQYLQPSPEHWKLDRYATPEDFARYK